MSDYDRVVVTIWSFFRNIETVCAGGSTGLCMRDWLSVCRQSYLLMLPEIPS